MQTRAASVALIAQIPESVSASWSVQPAPELALDDETQASILVLQNTWHFAMGRSVTSSAQLDATSEKNRTAALMRLRQAGDPLDVRDIPALGFLARQAPTRVSLLENLDPRLGRQTQLYGLLVLYSAAAAQQPVVTITVTAL